MNDYISEDTDPSNPLNGTSRIATPGTKTSESSEEEERKKEKEYFIHGEHRWLQLLIQTGWTRDEENNYCRPGDSTPVFSLEKMKDGRNALVFKKDDPESISAVISTMKDQGIALELSSPPINRDRSTRVYLEAQRYGVPTKGWKPSAEDIERVNAGENNQVQREMLTLTPVDLKSSYNNAVKSERMTDHSAQVSFKKFQEQYMKGKLGDNQNEALEAFTQKLTEKYGEKLPTTVTVQRSDKEGRTRKI